MRATLTARRLRELLTYNCDTGDFRWLDTRKDARSHGRAGFDVKGQYRAINVDGSRYFAHRLAWLWMRGEWPSEIDHINQNGLDNRISNLRDVSRRTNSENQRFGRNGLLGTDYFTRTGRWRAAIRVNYKRIHLGYFDTAEEAHAAYLKAKRELHAGCTI